ncbi:putative methyltransferase [Arthrobacter globiformis NBRC 12137]|uniref:Putative methyltransferase n=1 Tax=Arthrobacter globiformis (strain ATCC 8010 / DSM 20124 / JCM 1332 / NBRC 12137 / NCIMB 8907 / NRRL B-2979 / 168) TaxID=1077972 RepID=H0QMT9_ARTG1|nr:putative methyltransferase [Arthrobacter globiformis NBRC 12137]
MRIPGTGPGVLGLRDTDAVEDMDRPDCDPDRLRRTYQQFALVNRVVSGWHRLYRTRVRPQVAGMGAATVLDVGCGGGDLAVMLARWASKDGIQLHVTGIDPDERASVSPPAAGPSPVWSSGRRAAAICSPKASPTTSSSPTTCFTIWLRRNCSSSWMIPPGWPAAWPCTTI